MPTPKKKLSRPAKASTSSTRASAALTYSRPSGRVRQHGAVHGHRHGDLVERDAVEEYFHVLDGIDGDAGLAHVAADARVVGVVAAVGGQVEGHRDALAAAGQRPLVEGIGLKGG